MGWGAETESWEYDSSDKAKNEQRDSPLLRSTTV